MARGNFQCAQSRKSWSRQTARFGEDGGVRATQLATALNAELELFHALSTPLYIGYTKVKIRTGSHRGRPRVPKRRWKTAAALRRRHPRQGMRSDWDYPVSRLSCDAPCTTVPAWLCERHEEHAAPAVALRRWELLRLCPVPFLLVKPAIADPWC
jgi:hypothetical protein